MGADSEDENTTQAGSKLGKPPPPPPSWQHKGWSHTAPQMRGSAWCTSQTIEGSVNRKKINQNDLQDAWGWSGEPLVKQVMEPEAMEWPRLGDPDRIILRFSWADSPVLTSSALCKARSSKVHYFLSVPNTKANTTKHNR